MFAAATQAYSAFAYDSINLHLLNAAKEEKEDKTEYLAKALAADAKIDVKDVRAEGLFNYLGYSYSSLMWAAHRGHIKKV